MNRVCIFCFLIIAFIGSLQAQGPQDIIKSKIRYGFEINRRPAVNFNVHVNYSGQNWQPTVHVGISIQNDVLQFERKKDNFQSEYQISVAIQQKDEEETIVNETWIEEAIELEFDITNSRKQFQYHSYTFTDVDSAKRLMPGEYNCFVEVRDLVTKKSYRNKRPLLIKEAPGDEKWRFPSDIAILFANKQNSMHFPLITSAEVLEFNSPYLFAAKFPAPAEDSLQVNLRFYSVTQDGAQLINQNFEEIKPDSADLIYSFEMPYKTLDEGRYKIRILGKQGDNEFDLEKEFLIVWFDKPVYLYKADLAVRPLQYVLSKEEFSHAKGKSYNDLEDWMKNYWKNQDPSKETIYNELLYEFYGRVDQVNRDYTTRFKEGWETDQGKVYILYGPPQNIENKRYAANTIPYIIWTYQEGALSFTFTDKDQDGEFMLQRTENGKEQ